MRPTWFRYDERVDAEHGVRLPERIDGSTPMDTPLVDVFALPREYSGVKDETAKKAKLEAEGLVAVDMPPAAKTSWCSVHRHVVAKAPRHKVSVREKIEDLLSKRIFTVFHDGRLETSSPVRVIVTPPVTDGEVGQIFRSCGYNSKSTGNGKALSCFQLLTETSKMGCFSFNLPAGPPSMHGTCPSAMLGFAYMTGEDLVKAQAAKTTDIEVDPVPFICSACYALKGNYGNPSNVLQMQARLMLVRYFLDLAEGRKRPSGATPKAVFFLTEEESKKYRSGTKDIQGIALNMLRDRHYPVAKMSLPDLFVYAIEWSEKRSRERRSLLHDFGYTEADFTEASHRASIAQQYAVTKKGERWARPVEAKEYYGFEVPEPGYFRIHDAGDVWQHQYLATWIEVCTRLPRVRFWMPTRTWAVKKKLPAELLRQVPSNMTIRPSALHFREEAPPLALMGSLGYPTARPTGGGGLSAGSGSTVGAIPRGAWECPAYRHWSAGGGALLLASEVGKGTSDTAGVGGTCIIARGRDGENGCRVCWGGKGRRGTSYTHTPVFYHEH